MSVTLEQLSLYELASFLPPSILRETLDSLKIVHDVNWSNCQHVATYDDGENIYEKKSNDESGEWTFQNESNLNGFFNKLGAMWLDMVQRKYGRTVDIRSTYDKINNEHVYTSQVSIRATPVETLTIRISQRCVRK